MEIETSEAPRIVSGFNDLHFLCVHNPQSYSLCALDLMLPLPLISTNSQKDHNREQFFETPILLA